MEDQWSLSSQVKLIDWGEEDAVVYLMDSGDIHVVVGIVKQIIKVLMRENLSMPELKNKLNSNLIEACDSGYLFRQLNQLSSLGLIINHQKL